MTFQIYIAEFPKKIRIQFFLVQFFGVYLDSQIQQTRGTCDVPKGKGLN